MNKFESIEHDYQITALTKDMDLARILRENINADCNYVFILTKYTFAVFITKTLTNRLKKVDIDEVIGLSDIGSEKNYGFVRVIEGGFEKNQTIGETIRSIGFTAISSGPISNYDVVKNVIDNIGNIEDCKEKERQENAWKMNLVKVVAG